MLPCWLSGCLLHLRLLTLLLGVSRLDKTIYGDWGAESVRLYSVSRIQLSVLFLSALIPLSGKLQIASQLPLPAFLSPSHPHKSAFRAVASPLIAAIEMDKIFPPKDVPAIAIPLTVDGSGDADRKAPSVAACSCPICTRKSDSLVSNHACLSCSACRGPRVLTRTGSTAPATTVSMPQRTRSFMLTRRSATRMSPGRSLQRLPSTIAIGAPSPTSRSSISRCRHSPLPQ